MTSCENNNPRSKPRSLSYTEMMNSGQQRLSAKKSDPKVDALQPLDAPQPTPEQPDTH